MAGTRRVTRKMVTSEEYVRRQTIAITKARGLRATRRALGGREDAEQRGRRKVDGIALSGEDDVQWPGLRREITRAMKDQE